MRQRRRQHAAGAAGRAIEGDRCGPEAKRASVSHCRPRAPHLMRFTGARSLGRERREAGQNTNQNNVLAKAYTRHSKSTRRLRTSHAASEPRGGGAGRKALGCRAMLQTERECSTLGSGPPDPLDEGASAAAAGCPPGPPRREMWQGSRDGSQARAKVLQPRRARLPSHANTRGRGRGHADARWWAEPAARQPRWRSRDSDEEEIRNDEVEVGSQKGKVGRRLTKKGVLLFLNSSSQKQKEKGGKDKE